MDSDSVEAANFLLTLCHQVTFLLSKQIQSVEREIIEKGGYSENLAQKRLRYLKNSK